MTFSSYFNITLGLFLSDCVAFIGCATRGFITNVCVSGDYGVAFMSVFDGCVSGDDGAAFAGVVDCVN